MDPYSPLGRHLLSVNTYIESDETEAFPLVTLVCGVAASLIIVLAVLLCVCKEKSEKQTSPEVKFRNGSAKVRSEKQPQPGTAVALDETEVAIDMEGNHRHSNGTVPNGHVEKNGRPSSHGHRALPEVPVSGVQTDDEEEGIEAEGLYQVIPKKKEIPPGAIVPLNSSVNRQHLYEALDDDPTYAGVRDSFTGGNVHHNPYAMVEGVGDAEYAHVQEKKTDPQMTKLQVNLDESSDTLASVASIPAPPVPEKHFLDEGGDASMAATSSGHSRNNSSPGLPPRNSNGSMFNNGAAVGASEANGGAATLNALPPVGTGQSGASVEAMSQSSGSSPESGGAASGVPGKKKDPPYSSVTARESLANLKERQAQFSLAPTVQPSDLSDDSFYDQINYDQIKSSGAASSGQSDRQSLTSDLYAEIASGTGDNSQRSSMYAQVGDVQPSLSAPTPPPVETLKSMSLAAKEDDMPDPGYSRIPRGRPQSMSVLPSSSSTARSPIYAKVDKTRKRNTIHLEDSEPEQEMYSQVNKPKKGGAAADSSAQNNNIPPAYLGTGARPKDNSPPSQGQDQSEGQSQGQGIMRLKEDSQDNALSNRSSKRDSEGGYHTIGSVLNVGLNRDDSLFDDPNYDRVGGDSLGDGNMDSDPNYESLPIDDDELNGNLGIRNGPHHGLVHISEHTPHPELWHKRDHIYQEISETQREKERLQNSFRENQARLNNKKYVHTTAM